MEKTLSQIKASIVNRDLDLAEHIRRRCDYCGKRSRVSVRREYRYGRDVYMQWCGNCPALFVPPKGSYHSVPLPMPDAARLREYADDLYNRWGKDAQHPDVLLSYWTNDLRVSARAIGVSQEAVDSIVDDLGKRMQQ